MHDETKQEDPRLEHVPETEGDDEKPVNDLPQEVLAKELPEVGVEDDGASKSLRESADADRGYSIEALLNVDLDVTVVLGDSRMPISHLLKLARGSVIELEQRIGEPVRIVVNSKTVARGELVKLAGDRLGVSLTEIVREHIGDG